MKIKLKPLILLYSNIHFVIFIFFINDLKSIQYYCCYYTIIKHSMYQLKQSGIIKCCRANIEITISNQQFSSILNQQLLLITEEVLKQLPKKSIIKLIILIDSGFVQVIINPKQEELPDEISSYVLISLLPTMSKLSLKRIK